MRASFLCAAVILLGLVSESRADKIAPPHTYKVLSRDEKYVFVMLLPKPADVELDDLKSVPVRHEEIKAIRDVYTKSGLYRNDGSKEPLWTVDWYSRSVRVAQDGMHLVRIGGPHAYEKRHEKDRKSRVLTGTDMKNEAVSLFASGKLLHEFTIGELVDDPTQLRMGTSFYMWAKQLNLSDTKKELDILTLDGNRIAIDLSTAKILEKKKEAIPEQKK